jgi:hypothetical protein
MKLPMTMTLGLVLLMGCAQAPEDVPADVVSSAPYLAWPCGRLVQEGARLDRQVADASAKQEKAYIGDTLGVLAIGVPTASKGNQSAAAELSHLKGEQTAVRDAGVQTGCRLRTAS